MVYGISPTFMRAWLTTLLAHMHGEEMSATVVLKPASKLARGTTIWLAMAAYMNHSADN